MIYRIYEDPRVVCGGLQFPAIMSPQQDLSKFSSLFLETLLNFTGNCLIRAFYQLTGVKVPVNGKLTARKREKHKFVD